MDLLISVLATSFVVSTVDYFRFLGVYRVAIALAASAITVLAGSGPPEPRTVPVMAAAAAFASLSLISLIDRAVTPVIRGIR